MVKYEIFFEHVNKIDEQIELVKTVANDYRLMILSELDYIESCVDRLDPNDNDVSIRQLYEQLSELSYTHALLRLIKF